MRENPSNANLYAIYKVYQPLFVHASHLQIICAFAKLAALHDPVNMPAARTLRWCNFLSAPKCMQVAKTVLLELCCTRAAG